MAACRLAMTFFFRFFGPAAAYKHRKKQKHDGRINPELNEEIQPTDLKTERQIVGKFTGRYDVGDRLTTSVLGQDDVASRGRDIDEFDASR